jgi:hypothetical protein
VGALDGGLAYLSAIIAKADESDSYKASKDDREQLTDLWADYLKDKGADIPPGIMILIMTVVVYAPKLKMAWDDRKQNQIMHEQRERLIQQEMELRTLRAQVEQKTLSDKLKACYASGWALACATFFWCATTNHRHNQPPSRKPKYKYAMKTKFATLILALLMSCYALGNGTQLPAPTLTPADSITVSVASMRAAVKLFHERDYYADLYALNRSMYAACEAERKRLRRERWLYGGCGVAVGLVVGAIAFR